MFTVRLCLLEMPEKLHHEVSPAWLPKHNLNKDGSNRLVSMEVEKSLGLHNLRQRSTGNYGILRAGELAFPREEKPNEYPITMVSSENIYIQVTLYRLSMLYLYI